MRITLLTIGKTTFSFIKEGMEIYEKRLVRYTSFNRIEIPALHGTSSLSQDEIRNKEADLILKRLRPEDKVVLLDEKGDRFTSTAWAAYIERLMTAGTKSLVFVTGGAYGFAGKVRARADGFLSLSDMTFSHQIIRLFFEEQLYRAFTIIKGEPYHNE